MNETIFLHEDVENLKYFVDKNGISGSIFNIGSQPILYAMQKENIVGVFYNIKQAISFYENNKYKENLPIIYYYNYNLQKS